MIDSTESSRAAPVAARGRTLPGVGLFGGALLGAVFTVLVVLARAAGRLPVATVEVTFLLAATVVAVGIGVRLVLPIDEVTVRLLVAKLLTVVVLGAAGRASAALSLPWLLRGTGSWGDRHSATTAP